MDDIEYIKKLAGVNEFTGWSEYSLPTIENKSAQAAEIRKIEKEQNIKPGDLEWFDLWFSSNNKDTLNQVPVFRGRK